MDRHQHLALKRDPIANVRMDCVDKEAMKNDFWLLKDILTQDMHGKTAPLVV